MRTNRNLFIVAAAILCCAVLVWFSTSIQGSQKTYELRPQVTIGEYKTDLARIIDAYERLMERYMDLTERSSAGIGADLKTLVERLDAIDAKLTELSARTARIERALAIKQNPKPPLDAPEGSRSGYQDGLRLGSQK